MRDRRRPLYLILIMSGVSAVVTLTAILLLYDAAFSQQGARLVETAMSQARLIEAIARFDSVHSQDDHPRGWEAATLSQVTDAHKHYRGFGETGEFTLAKLEGNQIVFLLSHRHFDLENPKPVPFHGTLAEPMRRALSGKSGTGVALDYRGQRVLAAYEPLPGLKWGLVAKIDLAEVRAPFVRAGLVAACAGVFTILLGAALFFRITNPLLQRFQENTERLMKQQGLAKLGEMSAIVAHEIRNPLAGIIGAARMLKGRLPEGRTEHEICDEMISRTEDLNKAVNDMLAFSRPKEPNPLAVPVQALLEDTLSLVAGDPQFEDINIEISGPKDVKVFCDPEMIKRVFLNLLQNAAQAMESRGRIAVSVEPGRPRSTISFHDSGPGIPPTALEQIFEPFFTTKGAGTGLGLPIAKRVVELHRGEISIDCPTDGGTRVLVQLPTV